MASNDTVAAALNILRCAWGWELDQARADAIASFCCAAWRNLGDDELMAACQSLALDPPQKPYPNEIRGIVLARAPAMHKRPKCPACSTQLASYGECVACKPCVHCGHRSIPYALRKSCPACGKTHPKRNYLADFEAEMARRDRAKPKTKSGVNPQPNPNPKGRKKNA